MSEPEEGGGAGDPSPVRVPSIIVCDIDLGKVASVRENMPVQRHRESSSFS